MDIGENGGKVFDIDEYRNKKKPGLERDSKKIQEQARYLQIEFNNFLNDFTKYRNKLLNLDHKSETFAANASEAIVSFKVFQETLIRYFDTYHAEPAPGGDLRTWALEENPELREKFKILRAFAENFPQPDHIDWQTNFDMLRAYLNDPQTEAMRLYNLSEQTRLYTEDEKTDFEKDLDSLIKEVKLDFLPYLTEALAERAAGAPIMLPVHRELRTASPEGKLTLLEQKTAELIESLILIIDRATKMGINETGDTDNGKKINFLKELSAQIRFLPTKPNLEAYRAAAEQIKIFIKELEESLSAE